MSKEYSSHGVDERRRGGWRRAAAAPLLSVLLAASGCAGSAIAASGNRGSSNQDTPTMASSQKAVSDGMAVPGLAAEPDIVCLVDVPVGVTPATVAGEIISVVGGTPMLLRAELDGPASIKASPMTNPVAAQPAASEGTVFVQFLGDQSECAAAAALPAPDGSGKPLFGDMETLGQ